MQLSVADLKSQMEAIPNDLNQASASRKISLRRLNEFVASCREAGKALPDSARYLGGLTSIDYVVAVPEENDVYLVGSAEPWTIAKSGEVVGAKSGKPIFQLEDLLVAMRVTSAEKSELISCSIDPTPEALKRLAARDNIADVDANIAAMGEMIVNFTGAPAESRLANVLVAADYRMKRLSLGFDEAAIKNFASYFSMVKRGSGASGQRFWMEPKYDALYRDSESLVWKVSDSSVDVLTESEYVSANGARKANERKDPAAQRWASNMTRRYDELAKAEPVFADAKNCMDVALVAALIYRENLLQKAGCSIDELSRVETSEYVAPVAVQSDSLVRASNRSVASVTGGVLIDPWKTLENNVKVDEKLDGFAVAFNGSNWYAD